MTPKTMWWFGLHWYFRIKLQNSSQPATHDVAIIIYQVCDLGEIAVAQGNGSRDYDCADDRGNNSEGVRARVASPFEGASHYRKIPRDGLPSPIVGFLLSGSLQSGRFAIDWIHDAVYIRVPRGFIYHIRAIDRQPL